VGLNTEIRPGRSVNRACVLSMKAMSHGCSMARLLVPSNVCVTKFVLGVSVGEFAGAAMSGGGGASGAGGGAGGGGAGGITGRHALARRASEPTRSKPIRLRLVT